MCAGSLFLAGCTDPSGDLPPAERERLETVARCKAQSPPWKAATIKALDEGQHQLAPIIAGTCAEATGDAALVKRLADAQIKWRLDDINNPRLPAEHRLSVFDDLSRIAPESTKALPSDLRDRLARLAAKESEQATKRTLAERRKRGVSVGMTPEEALQSAWGKPLRVNRTTSDRGTSEQWVYEGGNYLYFDNGKLTVIQH